jgi:hypothetical protein
LPESPGVSVLHHRVLPYGARMAESRAPRLRRAAVAVGEGVGGVLFAGVPFQALAADAASAGQDRGGEERGGLQLPECGACWTGGVERPVSAVYCSPRCRKRAWHRRCTLPGGV